MQDGEEYLRISGGVDGLPAEGQLSAQGNVWVEFAGSALYGAADAKAFVENVKKLG